MESLKDKSSPIALMVRARERETINATELPPLALSIETSARTSGAGRTTLFKEIRAGRLKARKLGSRTLILASDLQDWLAKLPLIRP